MTAGLPLDQQLAVLDALAEEMARVPVLFDPVAFRRRATALVTAQGIPATRAQVEAALTRLIARYTPSVPVARRVPLMALEWDRPATPEAHQAELARIDTQLAPAFAALNRAQQGTLSPLVWPGLAMLVMAWLVVSPSVKLTTAVAGWSWGMGVLATIGLGCLVLDLKIAWRARRAKPLLTALAPRRRELTALSESTCRRELATWALVPQAEAYARQCMTDGIGVLGGDARRLKAVCLPAVRRQTQAAKASSPDRAAMLQELRAELQRVRST